MKTFLECYPCIVQQAINTLRLTIDDEDEIKRHLDGLFPLLREVDLKRTPPENGQMMYDFVARVTHNPDIYQPLKEKYTRKALKIYPFLKRQVATSQNPLLMAVRVAIAGNIIDFGANSGFDLERDVTDVLTRDFAELDFDEFERQARQARRVLYIGDNAGETVFDRVLIETLAKPTVFAVREKPIINDATREDAVAAGLDQVADIISSGSVVPGTPLNMCRPEFVKLFRESDMVIAKGQGNFETLSDSPRPLFLLFMAKCKVIADYIGVPPGSILLRYQPGRKSSG